MMGRRHPETISRHSAGRREIRQEFILADQNRDRRINFQEFAGLLRGLEAGMSDEEMKIGFREVDTDGDGFIDLREFSEWWSAD
jgi:calcium-binding protein CML